MQLIVFMEWKEKQDFQELGIFKCEPLMQLCSIYAKSPRHSVNPGEGL